MSKRCKTPEYVFKAIEWLDYWGYEVREQRRLTVRDLLTPGTTASDMIQYVKETGFRQLQSNIDDKLRDGLKTEAGPPSQ